MDILQDLCNVMIECMAGPFNQHFRLPVRFSAAAEDWIFGLYHDSLHNPQTGAPRRWIYFAAFLPAHRRGQLLAMYANPMYKDQLPMLLTQACLLLHDAIGRGAAVRLFALVPFDTGRTMSLGLGQSGGIIF